LVKNVKVNDYDGKSLSTSIKSSFDFELVKYESDLVNSIKNLKLWYKNNKNTDYFEFANLLRKIIILNSN
jgi:hypothetical protein